MPTTWGALLEIEEGGDILAFEAGDQGALLALAAPVFPVTEDSVLWPDGDVILWADGDEIVWEEV